MLRAFLGIRPLLSAAGLTSGCHPTVTLSHFAILQISASQPFFDLFPRIAIFDRSREAIKLVVDTNSKRKGGILFHRHFLSQTPKSWYSLQESIRPNEKSKRRQGRGKRESVNSPVWQTRGDLARGRHERQQRPLDRLSFRTPIEID